MSLSFEDSLKNNIETTAASFKVASIEPEYAIETPSVMTLEENIAVAAYSGDDGNWNQHPNYTWYNGVDGREGSLGYDDDNMSNIDEMKNVSLNSKQININQ